MSRRTLIRVSTAALDLAQEQGRALVTVSDDRIVLVLPRRDRTDDELARELARITNAIERIYADED